MKITFSNPASKRVEMTVRHNDVEYNLHNGESLSLNVKRGDALTYRVGKLSATHAIQFQSPDASFKIEVSKKAQLIGMAIFFAIILAMYLFKVLNNTVIATAMVIVALIAYEAVLYFAGYKVTVLHH